MDNRSATPLEGIVFLDLQGVNLRWKTLGAIFDHCKCTKNEQKSAYLSKQCNIKEKSKYYQKKWSADIPGAVSFFEADEMISTRS
ncbi:hypothetical protein AAIG11_10470 [Anoxynatronum sibiricum]|uniref:Uncharacterized protein n=2 Tax=Anoxynatronum sibiricum TaxID=210623 RepID=A0ABU9VUQ8_9CLOT